MPYPFDPHNELYMLPERQVGGVRYRPHYDGAQPQTYGVDGMYPMAPMGPESLSLRGFEGPGAASPFQFGGLGPEAIPTPEEFAQAEALRGSLRAPGAGPGPVDMQQDLAASTMAGPYIPGEARMSGPTAAPLPGPSPLDTAMADASGQGQELQRMLDNVLQEGFLGTPHMPRMGPDAGHGLGAMDTAQPASPGGTARRGKPASKMQKQVLSTFGGDMGEYNRWYHSLPEADRKKITNWSKAAKYMEQNPGSMMSREPGSAPSGPNMSIEPGGPNMSIETAPILGGGASGSWGPPFGGGSHPWGEAITPEGAPMTSMGPNMSYETQFPTPGPNMSYETQPPPNMSYETLPPPTGGQVSSAGPMMSMEPGMSYEVPPAPNMSYEIPPNMSYGFGAPPPVGPDGLYPMPGDRAVQGADGYYPMPGEQAVQGVDGLWPMGSSYGTASPMTPALPMRQDLVTPSPFSVGRATAIGPDVRPPIDPQSIMAEQMPPPGPTPRPSPFSMGGALPGRPDVRAPAPYVSYEESLQQQRDALQRYVDEAIRRGALGGY